MFKIFTGLQSHQNKGFFSPEFCIVGQQFSDKRKFSGKLKFREWKCPSRVPLSRRHCDVWTSTRQTSHPPTSRCRQLRSDKSFQTSHPPTSRSRQLCSDNRRKAELGFDGGTSSAMQRQYKFSAKLLRTFS